MTYGCNCAGVLQVAVRGEGGEGKKLVLGSKVETIFNFSSSDIFNCAVLCAPLLPTVTGTSLDPSWLS